MLKKSDNNEQIQDDMMDLLNQMADDEAASVNAGADSPDDDDGGIPLPKMPKPAEKEEIIEELTDTNLILRSVDDSEIILKFTKRPAQNWSDK